MKYHYYTPWVRWMVGVGVLCGSAWAQADSLKKNGAIEISPHPATVTSTLYQARPGPWGIIVGVYIYLEAPKMLVENLPIPSLQSRWTFPESSFSNLPAFFRKAGLDDGMIGRLLAENRVVRETHWVHLLPSIADLESIGSATRGVIYTELANYPQNEYQADPLLIIGASVAEWYASSKLRPEVIAKIEKLSYTRNGIIVFSDIQALLNVAQSDSEVRTIFKAFTRTRALMLRIKLDRNVNVEELISYWSLGTGLRRKDIEPIILSIIESGGVSDLPLTHLLPPVARKLIYTFPGLDMGKYGMLPDCHWTSLNFFNFEPDQHVLDARLATSQVLERFVPVTPPYRFGDILLFLDNTTGDAFHSCVFLADDLAFTKNGRNVLSPWVIMTVTDLKKIYLYRGNGRMQGFRIKDVVAAQTRTP